MERKDIPNNKQLLYKYAGLSAELMVGLGIAVGAGWWVDKKIHFHFPIAIWVFPLAILLIILFRVIKDTSSKK